MFGKPRTFHCTSRVQQDISAFTRLHSSGGAW